MILNSRKSRGGGYILRIRYELRRMRRRVETLFATAMFSASLAPAESAALTMDPIGWSVNFGNEIYSLQLVSSDPGTGGELRFRFVECCNGVFFNMGMNFDQSVTAVTSYSPMMLNTAYITSIGFSGSTVTIGMQSNFGGQVEWGVEFASYPTSGTFEFSPTFEGTLTGALVFVPEPSPGLLAGVGLLYIFVSRRARGIPADRKYKPRFRNTSE